MESSLIVTTKEWVDAFQQSHFLFALKVLAGLYIGALLIDIALLFLMRDIKEDIKKDLYGTTHVPLISDASMRKKWAKIEERLKNGDVSDYKVAVLETDALVDGILAEIGYDGENMSAKLDQLGAFQEEDAHKLREAHQTRNQIVFEKDFQLDLDKTRELLEIYKDFLKKLDFFK